MALHIQYKTTVKNESKIVDFVGPQAQNQEPLKKAKNYCATEENNHFILFIPPPEKLPELLMGKTL